MKKLLFMLVMMCCSMFAMADDTKVCKVNSTRGEVRLGAYEGHDGEDYIVTVKYTNDTAENVSIEYVIKVEFKGTIKTIRDNIIAYPGSNSKDYKVSKFSSPSKITITQLLGTKCSD